MFKRLMLWAPAAALAGLLLEGGCGWNMTNQMWWILAWLQEDLGS